MMNLFAFTEFAKTNLCTSQRGWFNIMMACLEVFYKSLAGIFIAKLDSWKKIYFEPTIHHFVFF